jgi:hypothetical protein
MIVQPTYSASPANGGTVFATLLQEGVEIEGRSGYANRADVWSFAAVPANSWWAFDHFEYHYVVRQTDPSFGTYWESRYPVSGEMQWNSGATFETSADLSTGRRCIYDFQQSGVYNHILKTVEFVIVAVFRLRDTTGRLMFDDTTGATGQLVYDTATGRLIYDGLEAGD